ncbi:MAG TPA: mersacidin/lichenicidin family type 2 lantibiotic [Blastocatellia bacterium]|nr:mersacidin/lichenicidin family type 2 lantibiotic [Blastocatellia bacterium]
MNSVEIVRSWKDEDYRFGLSSAEQAILPGDPAGLVALSDEELSEAGGGAGSLPNTVIVSPTTFVWLPPITAPIICVFPR